MISFFSRKITKILCEKKIIEQDKKDIYQYGYEIFISSLISFLIVVLTGVITGYIFESAVFYIVFVSTRQYSGGYHADSYLKCNIIFTVVYSAILLFSNILLDFSSLFNLSLFFILYLSAILKFAPIDNEKKKLSHDERKSSRHISIVLSFAWIVLSLILYYLYTVLSVVIALTLFSVAMLMVIEKIKRKEL